jgi:hypothetical protein
MTKAALVGRACGLAIALGIGVAIGFGTCAEASATPTDSTGSPAHGQRMSGRPAAAATVRVPAHSPARPVAAAAAVKTAKEAAPTGPQASSSPVSSAARAAVAGRGASQAAVASGISAPRAALKAAAITLGWCDPRGRQITIYKGTHFAIPNNFGYFIKQTTGTGTFTTNSAYDLKDVDQYDWNKFTGIAFTPLEPDRNSAMVGWRYNLTTQEFEIAPFYNVDKIRILPNDNPLSPDYEVIAVPAGETFQFNVDYTGITLSYGGTTVFKPYPPGLVPNVWTAARVSGWFGGNEVAPRTVSYFIHLN